MWNQLRCACPTAVVPKSGKGQMIPSSKVRQSCTDRLHGSLGSLSLRLDWTPIAQYQPFEWKRMLKDRLICQRGPTRRSPVALNFPLLAVSALCGAEPWAATRTKRSARLPSSAKHVGIERPTVGEVGCTAFVNPFFWVFWRMSLGFCRSFSLAQVGSRGGTWSIRNLCFGCQLFSQLSGGRAGPTSACWPHGATRKGQLLGPASKTGGMLYVRAGGLRDSMLHWPGFLSCHSCRYGSSLKTHEFLVIWGNYLGLFWYLIHPDSQGIMSCAVNCHFGWNQLCYDLRKPHGPHPPTLASPAIQLLLGQHGAAGDGPWVRAD